MFSRIRYSNTKCALIKPVISDFYGTDNCRFHKIESEICVLLSDNVLHMILGKNLRTIIR